MSNVEGWNRFAHSFFLKWTEYINSMFDVGRSTCPQCLDGGVSRIQPFELYIDVNTNQMHNAWQAGVRCSLVSSSIRLAAFQVSGYARMKLHEAKKRIAEPKNDSIFDIFPALEDSLFSSSVLRHPSSVICPPSSVL
jgi:hypothetical protein